MNDRSAILSFVAQEATFGFTHSVDGSSSRSIVLRLAIEAGEDVRTPEKRSLREAEWTLLLLEGTRFNETVDKERAIGLLSHHDEYQGDLDFTPETCAFSLVITPPHFDSLFATLRSGRLPDWISMRVRGMGYSWEPDGSGKEWDLKNQEPLLVTEITMRLPMASIVHAGGSEDEDVSEAESRVLPLSTQDLKRTEVALVSALREEMRQTRQYVVGVVVLLALVLLALWTR